MVETGDGADLFGGAPDGGEKGLRLQIVLQESDRWVHLTWTDKVTGSPAVIAHITCRPNKTSVNEVVWAITRGPETTNQFSSRKAVDIRAILRRLRKQFPVADQAISVASSTSPNPPAANATLPAIELPQTDDPWTWLVRQISSMAIKQATLQGFPPPAPFSRKQSEPSSEPAAPPAAKLKLHVTLNYMRNYIKLSWTAGATAVAEVQIRCSGQNSLRWLFEQNGQRKATQTFIDEVSIRAELRQFRTRLPVPERDVTASRVRPDPDSGSVDEPIRLPHGEGTWHWIEEEIFFLGEDLAATFGRREVGPLEAIPEFVSYLEKQARKEAKQKEKREQLQARIRETQQRQAELERAREQERKAKAAEQALTNALARSSATAASSTLAVAVPAVPLKFEVHFQLQDTFTPLADLRAYFLRERAALWWISNQSDDLLALPYCNIQRLDYQIRSALRAIGPLRGRALLSDEVGLGKTIEAGLVLKEYLTRGMVKRFLVLTVPSLVDQWEEELSEKFNLTTVTTNHSAARSDPEKFWRENAGIVASLHTLKQPSHLAVAQSVPWDMLIVDEAHYLRNRTSQAWQAVNALPRQFLLLLTATPVQNSLEELYNLVTLLQPGQLPSPKEFRARFIDPKKPHQPREPEELRRLLGQVMIRNTRANAGIKLPARRAETVVIEQSETELGFWQQWEGELRQSLGRLSASQASLWGRLLLQSGGSSPAAWREALKSFPDQAAAESWSARAAFEESWNKKCRLLEPLTKGEGGVVIFTQFLQTQAALAAQLRSVGITTFVVNGQTPARERQPITESFRKEGGALLLTHSGTEGRNLQFSHQLVNFDLPWNPMEIEQRIGRLHRLGQQHPVRIYNFVNAGTLQEHLLEILQEKLNLFELVVGETGLILGDRFTSDEFAEEILKLWRESEGRVAEAMQALGAELAQAREQYDQIKTLDETLFAKDYESL